MLADSAQYDQLLTAVRGFRRSIAEVQANDLVQSDSAYAGATRLLAATIQSVDEMNRNSQIATTAVYESLNGSVEELRDSVRDFRLNPKKYLRMKMKLF